MFHLLKQILLYLYFLFVRASKREQVIKTLRTRFKRRKIDTPVDEIERLPNGWLDSISFVGFDSQGTCIRIKVQGQSDGHGAVSLNLDIPGYGQFSYDESFMSNMQHDSQMCSGYEGKRIQIYCLDAMKRWKIQFRGSLLQINDGNKRVHASLLLYWQCLFDPYDHHLSPSCWELASNLSALSWRDIQNMADFENMILYEQWGEIRGRINIDSSQEMHIRLKSVRERNMRNHNLNSMETVLRQHFVLKETGLAFSQKIIVTYMQTPVYFGYLTFPIADSFPTRLLNGRDEREELNRLFKFPLDIKACGMVYTVSEHLSRNCFGDQKYNFTFKTLTVNKGNGFGVDFIETDKLVENIEYPEERNCLADIQSGIDSNGCDSEIVSLDESHCKHKYLVGGKASQLSVLRALGNYNVPNGFCITTKAFTEHIRENKTLREASLEIRENLRAGMVGKLKEKCEHAVALLQQTVLNDKLQIFIRKHLEDTFGKEEWPRMRFAVRSSSLSEDNIETSAAGQMDTYLCIQGLENIISAVQRCWASSLSYPVVEYRRQSGQDLLESMGVVVQEMVEADVSGVVFTLDPVTGCDSNLIINAAFGLGESVVSGVITPDTVVVNREDESNLQIVKTQEGSKETCSVADAEKRNQRNQLCIDEKDIYSVCRAALKLEKLLNCFQDIEWAISNGKLYILQARPVTALDMETDEDLIHEFDNPIVSEEVFVTTCNIQEMMPGAVSTLTGDLFISAADRAITYSIVSRIGIKQPVHPLTSCFTLSGQGLLNISGFCVSAITGLGGDKAKADVEIAVVGQSVQEHDIKSVRNFFGRMPSFWHKIPRIFREFVILNKRESKLFERLREKTENFAIDENVETAEKLYESIDTNLLFYYQMWKGYLFQASGSSLWANIIMAIFRGDANDTSVQHLADMALILSDCTNIISAEVPRALKDLAKQIVTSDLKEQFLNMPTEECDSFLKNSRNERLRSDYFSFMKKHGHRGIREADFVEKSWSQDPSNLMEAIKLIVRQGTYHGKEKANRTIDEIVEGLQTKVTGFQKFILKRFLIQAAINGAGKREFGKSYAIKVTEIFKRAYWRLAEIMVSESRIPDQKLLFFLTHKEIGGLLQRRSTRLIRLAKKRKRIWQDMKKIKYPKINFGLPKQILDAKPSDTRMSECILQGMPVCRGKAESRACVIKKLSDAQQILKDDILICSFTDVGWSPYFPLISGLVTEIGGLLSHGAVVARECGIPCIVNTPGATDLIQTGDNVILDGTTGTLRKM